jgi:hypothetical protein
MHNNNNIYSCEFSDALPKTSALSSLSGSRKRKSKKTVHHQQTPPLFPSSSESIGVSGAVDISPQVLSCLMDGLKSSPSGFESILSMLKQTAENNPIIGWEGYGSPQSMVDLKLPEDDQRSGGSRSSMGPDSTTNNVRFQQQNGGLGSAFHHVSNGGIKKEEEPGEEQQQISSTPSQTPTVFSLKVNSNSYLTELFNF